MNKAFKDPTFWLLLCINAYLVYHYYQQPEAFTTLIWLYWSQSVLMGFFTFLDLLTTRKLTPEEFADYVNKVGIKDANKNLMKRITNIRNAFLFLAFFSVLHLFYLVFITTMKISGPFQWKFYKYFLCAFFAGQLITFVQHKVQQRKIRPNLSPTVIAPFIRVLTLHLTIVLPTFLNINNMGFFLVMKSIVDMVIYIVTKPAGNSREIDAVQVSTQRNMNV